MKLFSEDLPATKTASILGLNRRTIDCYYNIFRDKIALMLIKEMEVIGGEIECEKIFKEKPQEVLISFDGERFTIETK